MKSVHILGTAVAILSLSTFSMAQEKAIQRTDLPPAVERSLQGQLNGATIKGFSTEKENGKVFYEAELLVDGHTKDISFDTSGNIEEVEEQVTMQALPAEVKTALMAKAKGGTITKIESLRKRNKLVAYEAEVSTSGRHSEIQVGPNGNPLRHEE